jgi:hypothetical protein
MSRYLSLIQLLLSLLPISYATPLIPSKYPILNKRNEGIQWSPCDSVFEQGKALPDVPIDCANLTVPLDYSDPNCTATVELNLLRVHATKQPSNGSVLLNFGGPGEAGRQNLLNLMAQMLA